jgi:uncharacterized membrane protein YGL010W
MKKNLAELMHGYRSYHSKKGTLYTHLIGVPLVMFSMFILFAFVKISIPFIIHTNLAWIGFIAISIYYLRLNVVAGCVASAWMFILCMLASIFTHFILFLIVFVVGWIFQLIGHGIEGKKPALLDNFFASVFIAPFFITVELLEMFGYKKV